MVDDPDTDTEDDDVASDVDSGQRSASTSSPLLGAAGPALEAMDRYGGLEPALMGVGKFNNPTKGLDAALLGVGQLGNVAKSLDPNPSLGRLEKMVQNIGVMEHHTGPRLPNLIANSEMGTEHLLSSSSKPFWIDALATNENISTSLAETMVESAGLQNSFFRHAEQMSKAMDQYGSLAVALEGVPSIEDYDSMLESVLDGMDPVPEITDPALLEPELQVDPDDLSTVEPAHEPRLDRQELEAEIVDEVVRQYEEEHYIFREDEIVECAVEECGNIELPRNAHRYQLTEDGDFICPQCQDEGRTFH